MPHASGPSSTVLPDLRDDLAAATSLLDLARRLGAVVL